VADLSAATYYYVVTRTENGLESGPIAEFNGTTAASNLILRLTWVDSRSASADYYTIYRSAAAAGTKQLIGRTNGNVKRFDDDGGYTPDTTVNPPTVAGYYYNYMLSSSGVHKPRQCWRHWRRFGRFNRGTEHGRASISVRSFAGGSGGR
jgi:hypothetical protein